MDEASAGLYETEDEERVPLPATKEPLAEAHHISRANNPDLIEEDVYQGPKMSCPRCDTKDRDEKDLALLN